MDVAYQKLTVPVVWSRVTFSEMRPPGQGSGWVETAWTIVAPSVV
jgi:hypothetical protein